MTRSILLYLLGTFLLGAIAAVDALSFKAPFDDLTVFTNSRFQYQFDASNVESATASTEFVEEQSLVWFVDPTSLPGWVKFDAWTRTLSGLVPTRDALVKANLTSVEVRVRITDGSVERINNDGQTTVVERILYIETTVRIIILGLDGNRDPQRGEITAPVAVIRAVETSNGDDTVETQYRYRLPPSLFQEPDGDRIFFKLVHAAQSRELPDWVSVSGGVLSAKVSPRRIIEAARRSKITCFDRLRAEIVRCVLPTFIVATDANGALAYTFFPISVVLSRVRRYPLGIEQTVHRVNLTDAGAFEYALPRQLPENGTVACFEQGSSIGITFTNNSSTHVKGSVGALVKEDVLILCVIQTSLDYGWYFSESRPDAALHGAGASMFQLLIRGSERVLPTRETIDLGRIKVDLAAGTERRAMFEYRITVGATYPQVQNVERVDVRTSSAVNIAWIQWTIINANSSSTEIVLFGYPEYDFELTSLEVNVVSADSIHPFALALDTDNQGQFTQALESVIPLWLILLIILLLLLCCLGMFTRGYRRYRKAERARWLAIAQRNPALPEPNYFMGYLVYLGTCTPCFGCFGGSSRKEPSEKVVIMEQVTPTPTIQYPEQNHQFADVALNESPAGMSVDRNGQLHVRAIIGKTLNFTYPVERMLRQLNDATPDSEDSLVSRYTAELYSSEDLRVEARLASGQPLPPWLHFDETKCHFFGIPYVFDRSTLNVRVRCWRTKSVATFGEKPVMAEATEMFIMEVADEEMHAAI